MDNVLVHVIVVNDDTDTKFNLNVANLKPVIDQANKTLNLAKINLQFDPTVDVQTVCSTLLNLDTPYDDKNKGNEMRQWIGRYHYGKLVIFYRDYPHGGDNKIANFSSHEAEYVVKVKFLSLNTVEEIVREGISLAHEMGHYFHLYHTAGGGDLNSIADAAKLIKDYIEQGTGTFVKPIQYGLRVFDGDHPDNGAIFPVSDTPPDFSGGTIFSQHQLNKRCDLNFELSWKIPVTFTSGQTHEYVLKPDRTNIMSYYGCPFSTQLTAGQIKMVRESLELPPVGITPRNQFVGNRNHLINKPGGKQMSLPLGSWQMNSNGFKATLKISAVDSQGNLQGTYDSNLITGFWDEDAQKITFMRIVDSKDPSKIQIFTGYLFSNTEQSGKLFTLTGSFEAFAGTGGKAQRVIYGWFAQLKQ